MLDEFGHVAHICTGGRIVPRPAPIGAAVVGCGYWGPNLARNLAEPPRLSLQVALRPRPGAAAQALGRAPSAGARRSRSSTRCSCDETVEAVVVATPPHTHHALAKRALHAGKHVLVEKPLATRLSDAHELADLAQRSTGLMLMPGHTFIYSPAVNAVRDLIQAGVVGDIHFVTSSRMNLGKYQSDGVVCDLAPHDLSILLYWLEQPVARGRRVGQQRVPGGRARDGVPDAHVRRRRQRQRAALLARAAQGAPDDRRRQQAHGPVRRHRRGRAGARVRPRHGRRGRPPTSASTS